MADFSKISFELPEDESQPKGANPLENVQFSLPGDESTQPESDWGDVLTKTLQNIPTRLQRGVNAIRQDLTEQFGRASGEARYKGYELAEQYRQNPNDIELRDQIVGYGVNPDALLSADVEAARLEENKLADSYRTRAVKESPEMQALVSDANKLGEEIRQNSPVIDSQWSAKGITSAILGAGVEMIPSIGATLITKKPMIGSAIMGGHVYGQSLAEGSEMGLNPQENRTRAAVLAMTETFTEQIPLGALIKPGGSFLKDMGKTGLSEGMQESLVQTINEAYDAGIVGEDTTLAEAMENVAYSFVVGAGVGAGMSAVTAPLRPKESLDPLDRQVANSINDLAAETGDSLTAALNKNKKEADAIIQDAAAQDDLAAMVEPQDQEIVIEDVPQRLQEKRQEIMTEDAFIPEDSVMNVINEAAAPTFDSGRTEQNIGEILAEKAGPKPDYGSIVFDEPIVLEDVPQRLQEQRDQIQGINQPEVVEEVSQTVVTEPVPPTVAERRAAMNERLAEQQAVIDTERAEKQAVTDDAAAAEVDINRLTADFDVLEGKGPVQEALRGHREPVTPEAMIRRASEETGPTPGELAFRRMNERAFLDEAKEAKTPKQLKNRTKLMNKGYRNALRDYRGLAQRVAKQTKVTPEVHTISEAITQMGGLDRKLSAADGIDTASMKRNKLFPAKGGMSFDHAAETLNEMGYRNRDNGKLDANDVLDLVSGEVNNGESHYSVNVDPAFLDADADMMREWARELGGADKLNTAISKALRGQDLGKRQAEVVDEMIEIVNATRTEQVDYAKQTLDANRKARREAALKTHNDYVAEVVETTPVQSFEELNDVIETMPDNYNEADEAAHSILEQAYDVDPFATDAVLNELESGAITEDQAMDKISKIIKGETDVETTTREEPAVSEPVQERQEVEPEQEPTEPEAESEVTTESEEVTTTEPGAVIEEVENKSVKSDVDQLKDLVMKAANEYPDLDYKVAVNKFGVNKKAKLINPDKSSTDILREAGGASALKKVFDDHRNTESPLLKAESITYEDVDTELTNALGEESKAMFSLEEWADIVQTTLDDRTNKMNKDNASKGDTKKPSAKDIKQELSNTYPDVKLSLTERGDNVTIENITVSEKNSGTGTQVMLELGKWADKNNKTLALTPSADFGSSKPRLADFYKRFGFVDNKGKNKNYEISESMIREPLLKKVGTEKYKGVPDEVIRKEVDNFTKEYAGALPVKVAIVGKQKDLPIDIEPGTKVKALYNPGDISMVIVAENFNTAEEVQQAIRHELIVHYGFRALMGRERFNMHLDRFVRSTDPKVIEVMDQIKQDYSKFIDVNSDSGKRLIAEEALARIAESDVSPSTFKKFVNAVLNSLKKIGILPDTATYIDAIELIKANADGLRSRVISRDDVTLETEDDSYGLDQTPYLASLTNASNIDAAPVSDDIKRDIKNVLYTGDNRSFVDRIKEKLSFDKTAARQAMIDQFASIEKYEKLKFGEVQSAENSAYKMAALSTDTAAIVEVALKHGVPTYKEGGEIHIRKDVKPLQEVFGQISDIDPELLQVWAYWMAAQRVKGQELIQKGKEKLFTQDMIDTIDKEVNANPKLKAAFNSAQKDYAAFNKSVLDFATDAGLLNQDQRDLWEHDSYVPFYRVAEEATKALGPGGARGIAGQSAGIRELKGGTGKLNIIENMVQNPMHLIGASYKNIAMQKVVETTEDVALTRMPMGWKPIEIDNRQIAKAMENMGVDFEGLTAEQKSQYSTMFQMNAPTADNVVSVMRDGKREYYEVADQLLLNAVTSLGPQPTNEILKLLGIPKRLLTNLVTSTPPFMVRNFIRDTMSNFVQADKATGTSFNDTLLDATMMRPVTRGIKGFQKSLREDPTRWKIMAAGGMSGEYFGANTEDVATSIIKPGKSNLLGQGKKLFSMYQKVIRASEEATRIATYDQVKANGGTDMEAAYQAKNVINFSRHGQSKVIEFLIATVPFFNARVQGLDRLYTGAKANSGSFVLRGAVLTAATMALMALNDDREEYWALNEWDRDANWHFWLGGVHFRIPKPFEAGSIFGTIPERAYEAMTRDEGVFWDRMGNMLLNTFSMNPIPQAFSPIAEQVANKSFFFDRPIVSASLQNLQPKMQYTNSTSESAKFIAQSMPDFMPDWATSPVRVEALINSYFGTVGGYVMAAGDTLAKNTGDNPIAPARRHEYDYYIINEFVREGSASSKYVGRFYEMADEANKAAKSIKDLERQDRMDEAREMKEEYGSILKVRRILNRKKGQMTDINARIKRVYSNRVMSAERKREMLDMLTEKKNKLAKEINDKYYRLF